MKIIKNNTKMIFQTLFIIVVTSAISVSASGLINSREITYNDNGNVSNVESALNTLYDSIDVATILPTGSIIPYMGTSAPENYLICDGTTYNIADYQKLADHIKANFGSYNKFGGDGTTTFAVPDLRGEFLRGSGTNSHTNQGNGAAVGTHQNATTIPKIGIDQSNSQMYLPNIPNGGTGSNAYWGNDFDKSLSASIYGKTYTATNLNAKIKFSATYNQDMNNNAVISIRPTNTSVNYIIKVK